MSGDSLGELGLLIWQEFEVWNHQILLGCVLFDEKLNLDGQMLEDFHQEIADLVGINEAWETLECWLTSGFEPVIESKANNQNSRIFNEGSAGVNSPINLADFERNHTSRNIPQLIQKRVYSQPLQELNSEPSQRQDISSITRLYPLVKPNFSISQSQLSQLSANASPERTPTRLSDLGQLLKALPDEELNLDSETLQPLLPKSLDFSDDVELLNNALSAVSKVSYSPICSPKKLSDLRQFLNTLPERQLNLVSEERFVRENFSNSPANSNQDLGGSVDEEKFLGQFAETKPENYQNQFDLSSSEAVFGSLNSSNLSRNFKQFQTLEFKADLPSSAKASQPVNMEEILTALQREISFEYRRFYGD